MTGAPITAELQSNTGEKGISGIEAYSGYVRMAYNADLYWPTCFPLYDRIRRSDPEVSLIRLIWGSFARDISFHWEGDHADFLNEIIDDIDGGFDTFRDTLIAYVPFLGWGYWEIVAGRRDAGWESDGWESQYSDSKLGIRKLAFRDQSSFSHWDMDDKTGEVYGMVQTDPSKGQITIPKEDALHITFGDAHNPEGLSPLEAVWRLERIKYGLEVVQGIGFEHSSGHAKFQAEGKLTADDRAVIRKAARAIMTAQEGNYIVLPGSIDGEIMDVDFAAAAAILEAIRYYGLLKLQIFNMQWVAIATTAGTGAYSASQDASAMFLKTYNAMMQGFADQMGEQIWRWVNAHNDLSRPDEKPRLIASRVEKAIPLDELGTFMSAFNAIFPMSEEDIIAIRKKSGFMSEELPEIEEVIEEETEEEIEEEVIEEPNEVEEMVNRFEEWARTSRPEIAKALNMDYELEETSLREKMDAAIERL
ncbi:MAG: hypothetical protein U9N61_02875 [Euryarchaeota archaeon]|nr:hypothetical protein [Euryarchaeota archaeon]